MLMSSFDKTIHTCKIVRIALVNDTGYPHDSRADKDSYRHDGRADKNSYKWLCLSCQ